MNNDYRQTMAFCDDAVQYGIELPNGSTVVNARIRHGEIQVRIRSYGQRTVSRWRYVLSPIEWETMRSAAVSARRLRERT